MYRVQLKARQQRSGETLQEFEANIDQLTRLAYPEKSEDFRTRIAHIVFTNGIRDCQLQQVLRMARHQNSSDALVHGLRFKAAKSATYIDVYKRQACRRPLFRQLSHLDILIEMGVMVIEVDEY